MKKSRILTAALAGSVAAMSMSAVSVSADTYHAYFGVQSASFTFRNAWDDGTYGQGAVSDDGMVYFDQLTGWEGATALNKGGVFTDVELTGDGTYSVSVTDFDFGSDESLNLLFVSTDIPLDVPVEFTDVKVILDGNTKYTFDEAYIPEDIAPYYQIACINIWNDDIKELFGYIMPEDSIEIQFTVSGLDAAAPAEEAPAEEAPAEEAPAPAEEAPAADTNTAPASTGNTAAAAIAAVMAVSAAAAVVSRRK